LGYSSKALAQEVKILLQEVGKLRDERRQLQFEVAELLAVKVDSPIDWTGTFSDTRLSPNRVGMVLVAVSLPTGELFPLP
jgi:hypothetical protein